MIQLGIDRNFLSLSRGRAKERGRRKILERLVDATPIKKESIFETC